MGTHNHLMRLDDGVFLEVIAPDPNVTPQRTRWFALDDLRMRARLKSSPQLISWVARVPNLAGALREVAGVTAEAVRVTRGSLSWLIGSCNFRLISVPYDGSMPFDGAFPTLIEWPTGPHPSLRMADLGCRLERLAIAHTEGARLAKALAPAFTDDRVVISTGTATQIRAIINTAGGQRELV